MKILITGGAGFIGCNLVRHLIQDTDHSVHVIDKLTYAGNLESLESVRDHERFSFTKTDICSPQDVQKAFHDFQPDGVMHLAAESHVDRSIDGPGEFIQTNIVGTFQMLQASREYFAQLSDARQASFRFLHVSTDEVYGSLGFEDAAFHEETPYDPHSPYSASKAGSDHLARAWHSTYKLPVIITNCSNNYGPYQFPEKLIPVVILKAVRGESIPVYGKGENVRDWLYVVDHAKALVAALTNGQPGQTYNVGGNNEQSNINIVKMICGILDETVPAAANPRLPAEKKISRYEDLITFVEDRPGHDLRYAINAEKVKRELAWEPTEDFSSGFRKTVGWYLENEDWWQRILSGAYKIERQGKIS